VFQAAFLYLHFGFVTREKLHEALSYKKCARTMLMKLTTEEEKKAEYMYNFLYKDIARLVFLGAVPFLILSVLNLKIFLAIRESRSQSFRETGNRFRARNQSMELELEQAHRSTLIISVYFFFLLFYIAKKCFVMFVYKNNLDSDDIPIECMNDPSTLYRMTKVSQSFLQSLVKIISI